LVIETIVSAQAVIGSKSVRNRATYDKHYYETHRKQTTERMARWRKANPEKNKLVQTKCRKKIKDEVLRHYSPNLTCARCGFSDLRALTIDHCNGGGNRQREQLKRRGVSFYMWLRRNKYPSGYQILCMNCQFIKKSEGNEYGPLPRRQN